MKIIDSLINKFKIKEIIGIVFFSSLIITFLPSKIIDKLNLIEFINKYQLYVSLALISSSAYYLFIIISFLKKLILGKLFNPKKIAIKYMKTDMSADEMDLLIQTFYDKTNNTFRSSGYIEFTDGRKAPLESKNIIYLASTLSNYYSFAYNLQPFARDFLNKNLKNSNIIINGSSFQYRLV